MPVACLFSIKVWRTCVYKYNIVSVGIPVVYNVCMFVWMSLPCLYGCDRHVGCECECVCVCLYPSFYLWVLHLPAVMLKSYRVITQNSSHKGKDLASMDQLYRNWQHIPCQDVYC